MERGLMAGYAVAHLDEINELVDGPCRYRPVRHHLGITAFGATAWTGRAAGELISRKAGLAYPIREGIPIMLPDEARQLDE